jgi:hypothetical protein
MTLTLHWQHFILIVGAVMPMFWFWIPYGKSGTDIYGIGGLFVAAQTIITWLVFLVIYLGLYYFGAFI